MKTMINFENLRKTGIKATSYGDEYLLELKKIFKTIENLRTNWEGEDLNAFLNKALSYKPEMENLGKVIGIFGDSLTKAANKSENIQINIKKDAQKYLDIERKNKNDD